MIPRSKHSHGNVLAATSVLLVPIAILAAGGPAAVQVREETLRLPTYVAGDPEPNPMFYFGRASQGAEGRVYPYPLYDTLTDRREDRDYRLIVLENEFVRLGVLPEIGGRLFEGIDKGNGYHFLYRQHVIKPALIGLIGAWISGGIEWNIPHHHRATTFLPVQHRLERHADGSQTVWVGELELRHRTRWAVGYTLHPGKSYFEAKLRLLNRTPFVHTLLCFANVAVHVDENYQVIFPPRTQFVTHHHKREFTTWPVATTRYGGYDFRPGVDVSWFKNHIAANSMFAWNYEDDFLAGYDHGRQAGLLSIADHHIVPGKKLWTWGNGPRGRMWDRILTDDDGPYIELMVGAYSDNQPDYSWLQPGEVKAFSIFWYPFQGIRGVKHANLDAAVNLEVTNRTARLGFCTTSVQPAAQVRLLDLTRNRVLLEREVHVAPSAPFQAEVALPPDVTETDLRVSLSAGGRALIAYTPSCPPTHRCRNPFNRHDRPRKSRRSRSSIWLACALSSSTTRTSIPSRTGKRPCDATPVTRGSTPPSAFGCSRRPDTARPRRVSAKPSPGSQPSTRRPRTPSRSIISASRCRPRTVSRKPSRGFTAPPGLPPGGGPLTLASPKSPPCAGTGRRPSSSWSAPSKPMPSTSAPRRCGPLCCATRAGPGMRWPNSTARSVVAIRWMSASWPSAGWPRAAPRLPPP
ncbi:MAG: DUF5107 domain-containing protein [Verrucomicrobia bacterium]|nr:DUF5107 domain-containing protein [Verrucomicrobiota bacterium]